LQNTDDHKEVDSIKQSTLSFDPMRNLPDSKLQTGHFDNNPANALNELT